MVHWKAASGTPSALPHGIAVAVLLPLLGLALAALAGDVGATLGVMLVILPAIIGVPWTVVDLVRFRQVRTTPALTWAVVTVSFVLCTMWILPYPEFGLLRTDGDEVFVPVALACLMVAERFAAHGWLAWRDRAAGAALGNLAGAAFFDGSTALVLAWALLVGCLGLRLDGRARLVLVTLAALPSLALGQFLDGVWMARAAEGGAFALYAASSWIAWRLRRTPPSPSPQASAPPA
jgi:hypothetical protein